MRVLLLSPSFALGALALAVTPVAAQIAPNCPDTATGAEPVGPTFGAADAGRIFSHTLSSDGRELYFFRKQRPDAEDYRLFVSTRSGGVWSQPQQLTLGATASDLYPALSPDGQRLVFSSYRPAPGDTSTYKNAHLWFSTRAATGWSIPQFVEASRLGYYHSGLQHTADDVTLEITTPDWRRSSHAAVRWDGTTYRDLRDVSAHPAAAFWRDRQGDSLHVWLAISLTANDVLLSVSRVDAATRRRLPTQFQITSRQGDAWTPLQRAGGGLGQGAPNFAWVTADGCWIHYTENYSQFKRVSVRAALAGAGHH
jgi:hypothetical protein